MTIHILPTLSPIQRRALEIRTNSVTNAYGELIPKGTVIRPDWRRALGLRTRDNRDDRPTPPSAA